MHWIKTQNFRLSTFQLRGPVCQFLRGVGFPKKQQRAGTTLPIKICRHRCRKFPPQRAAFLPFSITRAPKSHFTCYPVRGLRPCLRQNCIFHVSLLPLPLCYRGRKTGPSLELSSLKNTFKGSKFGLVLPRRWVRQSAGMGRRGFPLSLLHCIAVWR